MMAVTTSLPCSEVWATLIILYFIILAISKCWQIISAVGSDWWEGAFETVWEGCFGTGLEGAFGIVALLVECLKEFYFSLEPQQPIINWIMIQVYSIRFINKWVSTSVTLELIQMLNVYCNIKIKNWMIFILKYFSCNRFTKLNNYTIPSDELLYKFISKYYFSWCQNYPIMVSILNWIL